MSLVVASLGAAGADDDEWAAAVERELEPGDEVVWAGAGEPPTRLAVVTRVTGPGTRTGRGGAYGVGLRMARHPHVAFTDTRTVLAPGWRQVASRALDHHAVVGGPVLPGARRTQRSWAGFFVEYGPHAAPPYTSARGDLAANNIAYRSNALTEVVGADASIWKSQVNSRLRAAGLEPVVVSSMVVTSTKRYGWADLTTARIAHGRLFGAQQAASMSVVGRAVATLRCAVLPPVAYLRLARRAVGDDDLRLRFLIATPLVAVALAAWSIGEALGYATAREGRRDVD